MEGGNKESENYTVSAQDRLRYLAQILYGPTNVENTEPIEWELAEKKQWENTEPIEWELAEKKQWEEDRVEFTKKQALQQVQKNELQQFEEEIERATFELRGSGNLLIEDKKGLHVPWSANGDMYETLNAIYIIQKYQMKGIPLQELFDCNILTRNQYRHNKVEILWFAFDTKKTNRSWEYYSPLYLSDMSNMTKLQEIGYYDFITSVILFYGPEKTKRTEKDVNGLCQIVKNFSYQILALKTASLDFSQLAQLCVDYVLRTMQFLIDRDVLSIKFFNNVLSLVYLKKILATKAIQACYKAFPQLQRSIFEGQAIKSIYLQKVERNISFDIEVERQFERVISKLQLEVEGPFHSLTRVKTKTLPTMIISKLQPGIAKPPRGVMQKELIEVEKYLEEKFRVDEENRTLAKKQANNIGVCI